MNQRNIKVIGFDLGHGEVSLAKINDILPKSDKLDPQSLQRHGQKSQLTAVSNIENRGVVFGDQAMRQGASQVNLAPLATHYTGLLLLKFIPITML